MTVLMSFGKCDMIGIRRDLRDDARFSHHVFFFFFFESDDEIKLYVEIYSPSLCSRNLMLVLFILHLVFLNLGGSFGRILWIHSHIGCRFLDVNDVV